MKNLNLINHPLPGNVKLRKEADLDIQKLDKAQRAIVYKAIIKTASAPQPVSEGGFGKPLGNKGGTKLSGCLKVKLVKHGIRIVYKYIRSENGMDVIIVGIREDDDVYKKAEKRL